MKRLIAATTGLVASLTVPIIAFAATIDPCSGSGAGTGAFAGICKLGGDSIGKVIQGIILTLFILAVIIALFFLILGGIKWITSGGDKTKIESARNTIVAAIIGLILVFLAYFLLVVVLSLFGIQISQITIPNIATP